MKSSDPIKRLLFYIAINVVISALTTLVVLFIWDKAHQVPASLPAAAATARPLPTLLASSTASGTPPTATGSPATAATPATLPQPGMNETVIRFENVLNAGDLQNEGVTLKRVGDGELWLTGWVLAGEKGQKYTFPALILNKDGAIQILTRSGADSVIELFWGRKTAAWSSGETLTLSDKDGNSRASYRIP